MAGFKVLGISDEVTECHCCGRMDLKRTIILGILDADGTVIDQTHYGTECAAAALCCGAGDVRKQVKAVADETRRAAEAKRRAAMAEIGQRWFAWLNAQHPGVDTIRAIQMLGGFGKARAAFRAETGTVEAA